MHYAIIAAGEGSRLKQEGIILPKPLVRINGETLLERLIRIFLKNNAESVSLIINEEMTEVQEFVSALKLPVPFHCVVKSTPGSMHSFYTLAPFLGSGRFCLTTVDTVFQDNEFSEYISQFESDNQVDGVMAVTDFIDDEKPLYVATGDDLKIEGFYDSEYPGYRYISGGIYGLTPKAITILNRCMETGKLRMREFQRELVNSGLSLKAAPFSKIIDVDHAEDIEKAEAFLSKVD